MKLLMAAAAACVITTSPGSRVGMIDYLVGHTMLRPVESDGRINLGPLPALEPQEHSNVDVLLQVYGPTLHESLFMGPCELLRGKWRLIRPAGIPDWVESYFGRDTWFPTQGDHIWVYLNHSGNKTIEGGPDWFLEPVKDRKAGR